jgi:hypothetical protein
MFRYAEFGKLPEKMQSIILNLPESIPELAISMVFPLKIQFVTFIPEFDE